MHCPILHGSPQSTCHHPHHVNPCHHHCHHFLQQWCCLTSEMLVRNHHKNGVTDPGGSANAADLGVCANVVDLAEWAKVNAVGMEGVRTHVLHVNAVSG